MVRTKTDYFALDCIEMLNVLFVLTSRRCQLQNAELLPTIFHSIACM